MQTSLRFIILRSFKLNMLGSSFAEETLIREFLISCAAELKVWVLIPWAKEWEYLGEYYCSWGFLFKPFFSECESEGFCSNVQPVHNCTVSLVTSKAWCKIHPSLIILKKMFGMLKTYQTLGFSLPFLSWIKATKAEVQLPHRSYNIPVKIELAN